MASGAAEGTAAAAAPDSLADTVAHAAKRVAVNFVVGLFAARPQALSGAARPLCMEPQIQVQRAVPTNPVTTATSDAHCQLQSALHKSMMNDKCSPGRRSAETATQQAKPEVSVGAS